MKILVIGGMHGNEPLGIELVERLAKKPIKGVDAIIANPEAKDINQRFTTHDLNRVFPGNDSSYEGVRATQLLGLCREFDLVLDFHNTHCPGNDCVFIGEGAKQLLVDTAGYMDLKRIIVADYDCINKYATNCMSVEISLDSPRNSVEEWMRIIGELAEMKGLPTFTAPEKYRFVYRITQEDNLRLGLGGLSLCAFAPIDKELAEAMGIPSPAYPIFINDAYTPYNFGGLLNRL